MSFRLRLKYYLVHKLKYAGKKADELIRSGKLSTNGKIITTNEIIHDNDEIVLENRVIKAKPSYEYYALNKPRGIESSFDPKVKDNLSKVFPFDASFFVAGRLDKASEGLLLISNNGKWIDEISRPDSKKEKEYEVLVDSEIGERFLEQLQNGVDIGSHTTRTCKAWKIDATMFGIILTEGKNRQIRRMCKKLGKAVLALKRIRIDKFHLSDLEGLDYKKIDLS
jgi:23S rRNA pseudouridine2604 synthase